MDFLLVRIPCALTALAAVVLPRALARAVVMFGERRRKQRGQDHGVQFGTPQGIGRE